MDLNETILDANIYGKKRVPKSEFDFGDDATVGLKVKKINIAFANYSDHDFGVFLGKVKNQYHIGTMEILSFQATQLDSFNTLEELKSVWQLD